MNTRRTGLLDTQARSSSHRVRSLVRVLVIALLGLALLIAVS